MRRNSRSRSRDRTRRHVHSSSRRDRSRSRSPPLRRRSSGRNRERRDDDAEKSRSAAERTEPIPSDRALSTMTTAQMVALARHYQATDRFHDSIAIDTWLIRAPRQSIRSTLFSFISRAFSREKVGQLVEAIEDLKQAMVMLDRLDNESKRHITRRRINLAWARVAVKLDLPTEALEMVNRILKDEEYLPALKLRATLFHASNQLERERADNKRIQELHAARSTAIAAATATAVTATVPSIQSNTLTLPATVASAVATTVKPPESSSTSTVLSSSAPSATAASVSSAAIAYVPTATSSSARTTSQTVKHAHVPLPPPATAIPSGRVGNPGGSPALSSSAAAATISASAAEIKSKVADAPPSTATFALPRSIPIVRPQTAGSILNAATAKPPPPPVPVFMTVSTPAPVPVPIPAAPFHAPSLLSLSNHQPAAVVPQAVVPKTTPVGPVTATTTKSTGFAGWNPLRLGDWFASHGEPYRVYLQLVVENALDGDTLHSFVSEGVLTLTKAISDLGVTNAIHRRVLVTRILAAASK